MKGINNVFKVGVSLTAFVLPLATSCEVEEERPNILFAISDDQSFAHTSFAGATFMKTPAFDRVATEGVYFNNCLAGCW